MNFYSNISLFLFTNTLRIEIQVSKFHFSFFTEIENRNTGTLKFGFNEVKAETITCLIYKNLVTKPFCWSKGETT